MGSFMSNTSHSTIQSNETDNINLHSFIDDSSMLITVNPGDSQVRTFLNISCVIDISGSMGMNASFYGENNTIESCGLTILDLVKHAVTTVIKSLNTNDHLAIIAFSDSTKIILPLTKMDDKGQRLALASLNDLLPFGESNLWAGLELGLNVLDGIDEKNNRISAVLLFTDGEPNVNPPEDHLTMLKMYKQRLGGLPGIINTFGFGYTLDSQLLNDLAREGQGGYSFIPDISLVGTVFIHAIANLKVTIAKSCRLTIEPLNGTTLENPSSDLGEYLISEETWGLTVDIGCIQLGQTKDIVLQVDNLPPEGTAFASIVLNATTRGCNLLKLSVVCKALESNNRILPTYFRFKFINIMKTVMKLMADGNHSQAQILIENLINEMEKSCTDVDSLALLQDLKGQVTESLEPKYFQKWGRHYLLSLVHAHQHQICNNFKDIGLQVYGGSLYKTLRNEADTLFNSLPPPKRLIKTSVISNFIENLNMRMFNNSGAVCFHGKGQVRMIGGFTKNVESIIKGDRIETINGKSATVICVVETKIPEKIFEMVECKLVGEENSNGLLITPWHPIRLNECLDWIFPISFAESKSYSCGSVFNFVLSDVHIINVDDIDCVTLGHSFKDPVCAHDYFGTDRVIDDLKGMSGYESGLIRVIGVRRDQITLEVNGLIGN